MFFFNFKFCKKKKLQRKSPSTNWSNVGIIIEDAEAMLNVITNSDPTHLRRQANYLAHHLSRSTLLSNHCCT